MCFCCVVKLDHAWPGPAGGGVGTQVSCTNKARPSPLGIRFASAVGCQNHFVVLSSRLC